jgi:hypothetical protein
MLVLVCQLSPAAPGQHTPVPAHAKAAWRAAGGAWAAASPVVADAVAPPEHRAASLA